MIASEASEVECVKVLLDRGAEVDFTNDVSSVLDEILCRGRVHENDVCAECLASCTLWMGRGVGGY